MIRIADLLAADFSRPVEELVKVDNDDPDTVFRELTEYIATDRIRAEYERLFSAMAAARASPPDSTGVWISGFFGAGKSSFAKNLGYVLADRAVQGASASSLFLQQVESGRIAGSVELLHRTAPCEVFLFDAQAELSLQTGAQHITDVMYRVLLRDLDYAENRDIAELEMELEKEGRLAAFEDLCLAEYKEKWPGIRKGVQRLARASALLHRLDPRTYAATDTWLNMVTARPASRLTVRGLVEQAFDRCAIRRPGKAFAFIMDEMDQYVACGGERLENLLAVVEQFGREGLARVKAGKSPGPAWMIVVAEEKPPEPRDRFRHHIDLSSAGIRDVVAARVLRKKESAEPILRKLFRDGGCSRVTGLDEDRFVRFYPYLPHLIDLSIDIMAGIRRHPNAPVQLGSGNRTIARQAFEMLVSNRTRIADQPVGALVSVDRIYDLIEGNIPWGKQKNMLDIRQRFDDEDYPGVAARVARAICLMEFAKTDLPCTIENIAALLVRHVTEAPPTQAVATVLYRLKAAQFVRETETGWKLNDLDELRRAVSTLQWLGDAIGAVNPRPPGWHNNLLQLVKKALARSLAWYTRPTHEFNASVSQSLEEIVCALDRLSMNMVALDHVSANTAALDRLSMDVAALEARLVQSQRSPRTANPEGFNGRTAYIIGLFGTGRRYINELMVQNIGERAKYFRDGIRLHPGPTPMIYSGHATMRHLSRAQEPPAVMSRILEAVGSGFADLIFVYRHPLDSLLTNWIWWRTYLRDNRVISGIAQIYKNTKDLCADVEENFPDFEAFAKADPDCFAGVPGPRFLSFEEFVEETELHLQTATLALRLEDFTIDPSREFCRIAEVMSVVPDWSRLSIAPPRTRPYRHLAVKEEVPRFRAFIEGLSAETQRRIDNMGY